MRRVPLGDRDHQAKVRLDESRLGQPAIGLHPPQEPDRLGAVLGPIGTSHLLQADALVPKLSPRVELMLADPDHRANHETEPLLVDPVRRVGCGEHRGGEVPGLHPHGQVDLLGGGEEADLGDVVQVQPDRIVGRDLVSALPDPAWSSYLVFGRLPSDLEELDALLAKVLLHVHEEGLHLFGAEGLGGNPPDKVTGGDEAAVPSLRRDGLHGPLETGRFLPLLSPLLRGGHPGGGPVTSGRFPAVRGGWRGNATGRSLNSNQKRDACLKTLARPFTGPRSAVESRTGSRNRSPTPG
jgi:hypothetical protein